jgi:hypothetical protein
MDSAEKRMTYTRLCTERNISALMMQPWWLDAGGPWEVSLAVRNGQVVGAMPYSMSRVWGIRKIGMPAFTHHLQIWVDIPEDISGHKRLAREKEIIGLLMDDLPRHGFFSMVFEHDVVNNWLPFYWKGFRPELRYTFLIDREMWNRDDHQISRNLRRNIHDAEENLAIRKEIPVGLFYEVCRNTYQRQDMQVPYTLAELEKLDQAVSSQQAGIRFGAFDRSDECVAVAWVLWNQERAYYFISGDTAAGRAKGASIMLTHEALRIAFEEKQLPVFDFCGSMIEEVAEIRRQFGAKATQLVKLWKVKRELKWFYSLIKS